MADNLTTTTTVSTVPSGTVIATDDAGAAGHVQVVKLAVSTDGSATPLTANNTDGLLVNLGSNNDVTVTGTVAVTQSGTWDEVGINDSGNSITVDDGGSSLTVDGTVAVSGTVAVTDNGGSLTVDASSLPLPTGASTLAEQQTQTTALQLLDDTVYTDGTGTPSKAIGVAGTDGTNPQIVKTDANGELQVDVLSSALPSGAATSANQTTANTALSAIQTAVETLDNTVAGNELQVDIVSSALPSGASTLSEQQSQTTHLATIAGDTTDIETAVELIDDTVATLGTTTYSEATTKGLVIGAIRRDADTTLVDTTNEVAPLQVNAAGQLKVEIFDGGDSHTVDGTVAVSAVGGTVAVTQSGTWDEVGINDSGNSITVDDGGTTLSIDDGASSITVDGTVTANLAAGTNNIGDVDIASIAAGDNNIGNVDVVTLPSLPAGTNAIGKLAANSGVDIGDVDVTSISAGTNLIGDVDIQPRTTGGWSVANFTSGDTYTALTNSAQVIKGSAGKFGGYYIYNPNSSAVYVLIYNVAAASVTVGTTTAKLVFAIPATAAAHIEFLSGIPFDTAMSAAAATTGGGNSAPPTALECMVFYK